MKCIDRGGIFFVAKVEKINKETHCADQREKPPKTNHFVHRDSDPAYKKAHTRCVIKKRS